MAIEKIKTGSLTEKTKESLYRYIREADLNKSNKLPNEDELGHLLGVSRVTIRSTLNELAAEGLIFRKQGKGTFINPEALSMKASFSPIQQFKEIIENYGHVCKIETQQPVIMRADKYIANSLNLKEGDFVIEFRKVFYADNKVAAYCIDYFSKEVLKGDNDLESLANYDNTVFQFISDVTNKHISWDCVEMLTKTNLDMPELTKYFDLNDQIRSFLLLKGINYDEENHPLVLAHEYIDSDIIRFSMIRNRLIK